MKKLLRKVSVTIAACWLATALLMVAAVEARSTPFEGGYVEEEGVAYSMRPAVVDENKVWPAAECADVARFTEKAAVAVPEAEILPVNAANTRKILDNYNASGGAVPFTVPVGATAAIAVAKRLPRVIIEVYGLDGCRLGGGLFAKETIEGFVPGIFSGAGA